MSTYTFSIKYRAGLANKDADGLSRRPNGPPIEDDVFLRERERIEGFKARVLDTEPEVISSEVVSAVCQRHCCHIGLDESDHSVPIESLALGASAVPDCFSHSGQDTLPGMKKKGLVQMPKGSSFSQKSNFLP